MPNLNQLIITAALYKTVLVIPTANGSLSFVLLTASQLDWADASEGETIHAIGDEEPIGNKSNANKYSGKLTMQIGELNVILQACGFNSAIRVRGATLAITALTGGFAKVYKSLNINSDTESTKAKDKESLVTMDWMAIGLG
jgi:hypothetical protein